MNRVSGPAWLSTENNLRRMVAEQSNRIIGMQSELSDRGMQLLALQGFAAAIGLDNEAIEKVMRMSVVEAVSFGGDVRDQLEAKVIDDAREGRA